MFHEQKFPAHWGMPPLLQERDLIDLPGGHGQGSTTLRAWVMQKMREDEHLDEIQFLFNVPWGNFWVAYTLWLAFVLLTVFLKRMSLRPGGFIYNYDKRVCCREKARRRRRLRDTLKDPVLVKHWEKKMEYTLGSVELARAEMQAWKETVERWEQDGDDEFKEAVFYRRQGKVVVPSLSFVRLSLLLPTWVFVMFWPSADAIRMYIVLLLVHIVDNSLIVRKYQRKKVRRRGQQPKNFVDEQKNEVITAIGIPAAEEVSIV